MASVAIDDDVDAALAEYCEAHEMSPTKKAVATIAVREYLEDSR